MRSARALIGISCWLLFGCGQKHAAGGAESAAASRPVPVAVTAVVRKDIPIYLDGLGTVTAWKTVTVRSQVDGKLEKVLFKEGQSVKAGEQIAQIDPRPFASMLHQAEGALSRDTALLNNTKLNLERYDTLRKQKLVAQQQYDDQLALVSQYEGSLAVDRAQIESARLNLEFSRITAPVPGVTGVRMVDEGNLVHANDVGGIVIITQIDPIAVIFTLPEDDLHHIAERMNEGKLTVDAFSRDGETKIGSGELLLLDNQINQATATLRLKAVFPNPQRLLWPNQFVKARLLLSIRKDALVVPATAVQRGPKGTFAYVVAADDTASPHTIEVETLVGEQAIIAKGLSPGDQVVIEGQNQLRPGSKVAKRQPIGEKGAAPQEGEKGAGRRHHGDGSSKTEDGTKSENNSGGKP